VLGSTVYLWQKLELILMAFGMNSHFAKVFFRLFYVCWCSLSESIETYERLNAIAKQTTISRMVGFSASHEKKQEFIGAGNEI
jgi:hypothetical protein